MVRLPPVLLEAARAILFRNWIQGRTGEPQIKTNDTPQPLRHGSANCKGLCKLHKYTRKICLIIIIITVSWGQNSSLPTLMRRSRGLGRSGPVVRRLIMCHGVSAETETWKTGTESTIIDVPWWRWTTVMQCRFFRVSLMFLAGNDCFVNVATGYTPLVIP